MGRDSSVDIATELYGLDGPGIESRWGRDFPHLSKPTLSPTSLLYNGYRVFPGGKKRPGRDADPSLPSSAVGHERVELYLYFPYGPYGLYRALVPVQGCITWPEGFKRLKIATSSLSNEEGSGNCHKLNVGRNRRWWMYWCTFVCKNDHEKKFPDLTAVICNRLIS